MGTNELRVGNGAFLINAAGIDTVLYTQFSSVDNKG